MDKGATVAIIVAIIGATATVVTTQMQESARVREVLAQETKRFEAVQIQEQGRAETIQLQETNRMQMARDERADSLRSALILKSLELETQDAATVLGLFAELGLLGDDLGDRVLAYIDRNTQEGGEVTGLARIPPTVFDSRFDVLSPLSEADRLVLSESLRQLLDTRLTDPRNANGNR